MTNDYRKNHQTIKPSNHQTVKPSNRQTVKPSNRQTIKPLNSQTVKRTYRRGETMCMLDMIRERRADVYDLVRKYKGDDVYVFGSCARKEETPNSDIDFLITFNGTTLFDLVALGDGLEKLFGRKVDLLSSRMVKDDSFGREVKKDMVAI